MATYQVSRSLYRRLTAELTGPPETGIQYRRRVLHACELTMSRIEHEPDFADPARFLFDQIRTMFPVCRQAQVRRLIDRHIELAELAISLEPPTEQPCSASTRSGTPCKRPALLGSRYCPSHRHLERELEESPAELAAA